MNVVGKETSCMVISLRVICLRVIVSMREKDGDDAIKLDKCKFVKELKKVLDRNCQLVGMNNIRHV